MIPPPPAPLRLRLDGDALVGNWRALAAMAGPAACGAAVKADGYGLGAVEVARRLVAAGCRDFFVATWAEAVALAGDPDLASWLLDGRVALSVLHGVRAEDMATALALPPAVRPVLNTPAQVARWAPTARACDVMVDTGMNRLGVAAEAVAGGLLDGLVLDTLMSHLACAEDAAHLANARQRNALAALGAPGARRRSLANSAGVALGRGFAFDLVRPGLALYGGVPCPALAGVVRQVAVPEAQLLQRRRVRAGEAVGYDGTWTAPRDTDVAILNIGYADGYARAFSNVGRAQAGGVALPVLGRVSMDLLAIDVDAAPDLGEGDWVAIDYALPEAAAASGTSQYELLTRLGTRFERRWA